MPDEMEKIIEIETEMRRLRRDKGMTQSMLASAANMRQPSISHIENGTTKPMLDSILKCLAPLGKTLAIVDVEGTDA